MKRLSIMLKPASSLCNLRCRYCFYADIADLRDVRSYGIMPAEKVHTMLRNLQTQLTRGDSIQFGFQGGEPTIAGLPWFREFVQTVSGWDPGIQVSYALQTNATLLDEEWCRFLSEHHFLVGVSLDLLPQCHNDARVDACGEGTYQRCLQSLDLLNRFGVEYNVLCTLTRQVARHPQKVWKTLKELDIRYVQFTPCLDALDTPGANPYALTPQRFAQFYTQLFPLWLEDFRKGQYRSVKLFDDVVNLMAYGIPTACGIQGRCQPQLVVEADGSVFPCDFYCLDEYRIGNLLEDSLEALLLSAQRSPAQKRDALPELCSGCPYRSFCGGGCKRMQKEIACSGGDTFCGYRSFLNSAGRALQQIARQQRMSAGIGPQG